MTAETTSLVPCSRCRTAVDPARGRCPRCGGVLAPARPSGGLRATLDNRYVILALLFLVTGALGIPLLWWSRAFTLTGKSLLTAVVTLYTAALIWGTWLVVAWAYSQIMQHASSGAF